MDKCKRLLLVLAAAALLAAVPGCGRSGSAKLVTAGKAAAEKGDWEGAFKSASKALERSPKSVDALLLKALAAKKLGRHGDAYRAASKAAKLEPKNFSAQFMLGWVCMDDPAKREEAKMAFLRAYELRPQDRDTLIALCNLAADKNDPELLDWLEKLQKVDGGFAKRSAAFHNQMGIAYLRAGKDIEAFKKFKKARSMSDGWNDPHVVYNVACIGDRLNADGTVRVGSSQLIKWYRRYLDRTKDDASAEKTRELVKARLKKLERPSWR